MVGEQNPGQPSSGSKSALYGEMDEALDVSKSAILVEGNAKKRKKSTIEWRDIVDNEALTPKEKYPLLHSKELYVRSWRTSRSNSFAPVCTTSV